MTIESFKESIINYADIIEFKTYTNEYELEVILQNKTGNESIYENLANEHLSDFICLSCHMELNGYFKAWYQRKT